MSNNKKIGPERYIRERCAIPADSDACWVWSQSKSASGYGCACWEGKQIRAHRLSYLTFKGEIGSAHVLHTCHNPSCVNPLHLRLGTHAENMQEKAAAGRAYRMNGAANHKSKLDEGIVRTIRNSSKTGGQLAKEIGVSRTLVNMVRRNEIWRHVG
jgi:hypothetical protein